MPIDMSNYKMIYKDQVFNVISITLALNYNQDNKTTKIASIQAAYIDEDGEIKLISDEAFMFKFVRR